MTAMAPGDSRTPFRQRLAAVGLILIECLMLHVGLRVNVFPTFAAAIALGGLLARQNQMTRQIQWNWSVLFLGMVFVFRYSYSPVEFPLAIDFVNTSLAYEIVCFLISLQLLVLFDKDYETRIPAWFLVLAVFSMVFSMDARFQTVLHGKVLVLVLGFVGLMGLFSHSGRRFLTPPHRASSRARTALLVFCILGGLGTGATGSILIRRYERTLEAAIASYLSSQASRPAGFSGTGGLTDILENRLIQSNTVALRVFSDKSPEYLRGRAFDLFEQDHWTVTIPSRPVEPERAHKIENLPRPGDRLFRVSERRSSVQQDAIDVWPDPSERSVFLFLPASAESVIINSDSVQADPNGVASLEAETPGTPYTVLFSQTSPLPGKDLDADLRAKFLQLPFDPYNAYQPVYDLAEQLTAGCEGYEEKTDAIQSFFAKNFEYKIGFDRRRGQTALGQFLLEDRAAHCEYFASATVILLRLSGIPARYVTGYVVPEWNERGKFWVARKKHAHAWVEAYDDATRTWNLIDTTPSDGIPSEGNPSAANQNWEAWIHQWHRWKFWLINFRLDSLLSWEGSIWLLPFALLAAAYAAIRMLGVGGIIGVRAKPAHPDEAGHPVLVNERRRLDRFLEQRGWKRLGHETILDFADRIGSEAPALWGKQVSAWYRQYAQARFGPGDPLQVAALLKSARTELQATRFRRLPAMQSTAPSRDTQP